MIEINPFPFKGLSDADVATSEQKSGTNVPEQKSHSSVWLSLKNAVIEPMFLLLVACCIIYFVLGEISGAWFMLGSLILVSAISIYQENRSRHALEALAAFTQPLTKVIRNNELVEIPSATIVVGDIVVANEGELIPADGILRQGNDLAINESILTGEAFSVPKDISDGAIDLFGGTLVVSGQGILEITSVGSKTRLGKIGSSVDGIANQKTPLQLQINAFVKMMAIIGIAVFVLIWGVNYYLNRDLLGSLLRGLTIAMSIIPEEIPVAFATFMALGAWRLMQIGIIVKQTSTVEALGAATVLCTDKTGTITENTMALFAIYALEGNSVFKEIDFKETAAQSILSIGMWASEAVPFDPMEKALHEAYGKTTKGDLRPQYHMVHEYPLSGKPPMMTHVFEDGKGDRIIACKGAPEAIMACSNLRAERRAQVSAIVAEFGKEGLRVLGVATARHEGNEYPATQQEFKFDFAGLVAFYDPPKKNIGQVFKAFADAGIAVKMITGDNAETAGAIARQIAMKGSDRIVTGNKLSSMTDSEFDSSVLVNNVFARMQPELKLRIIESLQRQGQVVGMTGDGVNDGPALRAANIGIAMGKRGSELARQASALILTDDDFGKMIDAVAMGRKTYANIKKAVQYIISIHIPIILSVALPSVLGWKYPVIFSPIHVIFLELIMGPTCSIVYENEPLEQDGMLQPPRKGTVSFFNAKELTISILQGIGITIGILLMYFYSVYAQFSEELTRSMVFTTLIFSNILLALANRSFRYSIFATLHRNNPLFSWMIGITLSLLALLLYVPILSSFFKLATLDGWQILVCAGVAVLSITGFELYKWVRRVVENNV